MELKKLEELISNKEFCEWAGKKSWKFKFPVYQRYEYMDESIEALDLSVRSYNCLKRAGFNTINDMVSAINGREDLNRIRNLGRKSSEEIMVKLFLFQYSRLSDNKRVEYLEKIRKLNCN